MVSDKEINIALAEFDGWELHSFSVTGDMWIKKDHEFLDFKDQLYDGEILRLDHPSKQYTTSLDALLSIVDKLQHRQEFTLSFFPLDDLHIVRIEDHMFDELPNKNIIEDESPSKALALACYKIIKELKNEM